MHGSEGEGRWRAFSIGDLVRWTSVAEVDGKREKITITGVHSSLKEFEVSDPEPTDDEVGTTVVIENIREGVAAALLNDDAVDHLNAEFALYLEMYADVEIRYRNFRVDPAAVAKNRQTYPIALENPYGPAQVTIIEWPHDVRRTMLHRVLQEVLDLSQARLEELEHLLERTTLSAIIAAAKVVADRLDFLRGLEVLVYEPESKRALLERRQLHKMLAQESWVFGDEYTLAVNDESLTAVLRKHVKLLGRDELAPDNGEEVLREDDSRGIVDLMLGKTIKSTVQRHDHLVVELKRPAVKIGADELTQIQRYASAVARDERFNKTETAWNFWVVSNELDAYAEDQAAQADRPPGVVFQGTGIRVWAKTWAQVIDDCEQRLKFVKANLEIESVSDDAVDYLRRTYERFLPKPLAQTTAA